ncbi:hypothetical protein FRC04_010967 [Tulasnella sp. 424]|nr:hypothetical protein FRC04_010967 [Tulasnella sp. 424]
MSTPPFVATIFIEATSEFYDGVTPSPRVQHDVESIFWVAMYTIFESACREGSQSTSRKEHKALKWCSTYLQNLQHPETLRQELTRKFILKFDRDLALPEKWAPVRHFLSQVASICKANFEVAEEALGSETDPDPQIENILTIVREVDMVDRQSSVDLEKLPPRSLPGPNPRSTSPFKNHLRDDQYETLDKTSQGCK